MATVTRFPSANAADVGAGLTNPNNAHADDGSYATAAPGKNTTLGQEYQNFGFDSAIPAGAQIVSVTLNVEWKVSVNTSIATLRVRSSVSESDGTNHDNAAEPTTDTAESFNITAERTWTRNDLLDGTFEVELHAVQGNSSTAVTFSFDYVSVTVVYEPVEPLFSSNRMICIPIRI